METLYNEGAYTVSGQAGEIMKKLFINLSNHRSEDWSGEQIKAAKAYGTIVDLPFPAVPAEADEIQVADLAEDYRRKVLELASQAEKTTVMLEGEFTFTYALVRLLQKDGIPVYAACTARDVTEEQDEQGRTVRRSTFRFVRFRRYEASEDG